LVSVRGAEVVVRLTAACAGCPGSGITTDHVLAPLLRTVVDGLVLKVERAP
jgi:Fe-S cluster biogenesis protein NfuA